jgi:hypothetical protein
LEEVGAGLDGIGLVEEEVAGALDFLAGEGSGDGFGGEFGEFHLVNG